MDNRNYPELIIKPDVFLYNDLICLISLFRFLADLKRGVTY